jgi:predicted GIY-YIG superfamily endonuclease
VPALYILQSQTTGNFYIGSAFDLEERLSEHRRGHRSIQELIDKNKLG